MSCAIHGSMYLLVFTAIGRSAVTLGMNKPCPDPTAIGVEDALALHMSNPDLIVVRMSDSVTITILADHSADVTQIRGGLFDLVAHAATVTIRISCLSYQSS